MSTEVTIYPICDGWVEHDTGGGSFLTWANIIIASGTDAYNEDNYAWVGFWSGASLTDKWRGLYRGILVFDITDYTDVTFLSAKLRLYGLSRGDTLGAAPTINAYGAVVSSGEEVVPSDFEGVLFTPFSADIAYADWLYPSFWNEFSFNDDGLAYLNSKRGLQVGLSMRNANYDVVATPPSWQYNKYAEIGWAASYNGESTRPQLVLRYIGLSPRRTCEEPIKDIITLEAVRNMEMAASSRFYIDEEGKATYKSRFARSG